MLLALASFRVFLSRSCKNGSGAFSGAHGRRAKTRRRHVERQSPGWGKRRTGMRTERFQDMNRRPRRRIYTPGAARTPPGDPPARG